MFHGEIRVAPAAPLSAPVARFLVQIAGFAMKVARHVESRRALARLGQLDDRMLSDIGLTRTDLRDASAAGPGADAIDILAMRRRERRASRPKG